MSTINLICKSQDPQIKQYNYDSVRKQRNKTKFHIKHASLDTHITQKKAEPDSLRKNYNECEEQVYDGMDINPSTKVMNLVEKLEEFNKQVSEIENRFINCSSSRENSERAKTSQEFNIKN